MAVWLSFVTSQAQRSFLVVGSAAQSKGCSFSGQSIFSLSCEQGFEHKASQPACAHFHTHKVVETSPHTVSVSAHPFTLYEVSSHPVCWTMSGKTRVRHTVVTLDQPGTKLQSRAQKTVSTFTVCETRQTWV